mmetsp:Transcript_20200/g.24961  ORF Transcript_20200/g.24961 Transcript_20200/m.24961 type:complete len:88 (-) Transcript_20200:282-545(-)
MFHAWFLTGFILALSAAAVQLFAIYLIAKNTERRHWTMTLYIVMDAVIMLVGCSWLGFGAYWRLSDQGALCANNFIRQQGEVMLLFY